MTAHARHYAVLSLVVGPDETPGTYTLISRMDGTRTTAVESTLRLDVPANAEVVAREGVFTYRPALTLHAMLTDAISGMAGGIFPEGRP